MAPTPSPADIKEMYTLLTGNKWDEKYNVLIPSAAKQAGHDGIAQEFMVFAVVYLIAHYLSPAGNGAAGRVVASETLGNASVSYAVMKVGTNLLDVWLQRYNELARNSITHLNVGAGPRLNRMYALDSSRHPNPLTGRWSDRDGTFEWRDPDI